MLLSDKYPFLTNYFTQVMSESKKAFPQSILFYGSNLQTQYILATEIARLLNCSEKGQDDCNCLNCKWIREGIHPEVLTISRLDNKPADDDSSTVISIKQGELIKERLLSVSDYHRVIIFCDRDDDGNVQGLNQKNFQAKIANSLLKLIEEPQPRVTFIFLTRYIDDMLPTIISRSQCFFVPSTEAVQYDYSVIDGIFTDYFNFDRKDVFDVSQNLQDLTKSNNIESILEGIQCYILNLLKSNPTETNFISHIKYVEEAIHQAKLGMRPANIFDELCLNLIK